MMKNYNKKTVCIALALFLTLGMTACSAGQSAAEPSQTAAESSALPDTEKPTEKSDVSLPDDVTDGEITPRITSDEPSYSHSYDLAAGKKSLTADFEGALVTNDIAEYGAADTAEAAEPAATAPKVPTVDGDDDPAAPIPDDTIIEDIPYDPYDDIPEPQAGLLTAGEWNDNDNWGFFTNLINSGTITFPSYGIDPRYRTKMEVKATDGTAVVNAKVTLYNASDEPLWTAISDKQGIAYLFAAKEGEGTYAVVESNGKTQQYDIGKKDSDNQQGQNVTEANELSVTFDGTGTLYQKTDIMFIMDATGSMSDEMLFLQSEFTAISEAAGDQNTRYSVNFYRDKGDEFTTKCYDFTNDVKGLQEKLNSESADGGGDMPEAIAEILEETIVKSNWDEDSVKLAFMIFDAPPHEETVQSLQASIKTAAEKGIHLIPVISSGTERDTELFGRAIAIVTNGTYVFLTDDSGIGYSHLEPIIGSYQVEKLYDIIVRIIDDYRQA